MADHAQPSFKNDTQPTIARGLPADFYTDPAVFEREKARIFFKDWQCVGHVAMAREPGEYFTAKVVDQELVVVRGKDGELRAFFNVCQHRGHDLVKGCGKTRQFVCPYHAWTYELDGRLRGAPGTKGMPAFDAEKVRLKEIRLRVFAGMIFVNLGRNAAPFPAEFLAVEDEIRSMVPDIEAHRVVVEHPLIHRCNWKASVENFSECYHCPTVHGYLTSQVIRSETYRLDSNGWVQRHRIEGRDGNADQWILHLWPNTAVGLYPIPELGEASLCMRHMYPIDHETTIYHYRWLARDGVPDAPIKAYARHHTETTGAEDCEVAGGVQRGMRSLGFDRAHLILTPDQGHSSEHAIAAFHDRVREALGEDIAP
jgi:phenylpropionate dioxygenase-like ring-hydroxylating dioxygenase large terminal subunit